MDKRYLLRAILILSLVLALWFLALRAVNSADAGELTLFADLTSHLRAGYAVDADNDLMWSIDLSIIAEAYRDRGEHVAEGGGSPQDAAPLLLSPIPTATSAEIGGSDRSPSEGDQEPTATIAGGQSFGGQTFTLTPTATPTMTATPRATATDDPVPSATSETTGTKPPDTLLTTTATKTGYPTYTPFPSKTPAPSMTIQPTGTTKSTMTGAETPTGTPKAETTSILFPSPTLPLFPTKTSTLGSN